MVAVQEPLGYASSQNDSTKNHRQCGNNLSLMTNNNDYIYVSYTICVFARNNGVNAKD